ncbi:NAD(P)/FAD-dependent oxidoreductase [Subtercola endophyticus]|uniref:NAD(P)/FAD-dependent oxidoreductase n=1 Tax=Subtercola endophyticus TaxID=2895559 RepID=UPI001E3C0CA2|nr:FAD-dependent oxidoreductase [Subtercola endophyticus]UFS59245.1 FAD-dependent oxidoreductase [Subtercola endophyticus]
MTDQQNIVIVGAALAGASAAKALREQGFAGEIRMLGAESHRPYIRPPLSKGFLAGTDELDSVFVEAEGWYAERDVDLDLGVTVDAIDPEAQFVFLDSGEAVMYDKLLLATGSSARQLDVPGADLDGVFTVRTLDDAQALHAVLAAGDKRVIVVGSGWIGLEVAATARTLGNEVTVLDRGRVPLASVLGDELGQVFLDLHREHGVVVRSEVEVAELLSADAAEGGADARGVAAGDGSAERADARGAVTAVKLTTGDELPADVVVVGIGATPNIRLAEAAGLDIDNGVLVNAALRTSDPNIWAVGDIANAFHPVITRRVRSEHWANALNQGTAVAASMLGRSLSYDEIPYFYSDQFDLGMEYSGYSALARGASVVYRGDVAAREFIAFWLAEGRVVAGMNVNVWEVNEAVQGIIRRANLVDPARLADPAVPLDSL